MGWGRLVMSNLWGVSGDVKPWGVSGDVKPLGCVW